MENELLKKVQEIERRRYSPGAKNEAKYLAIKALHEEKKYSIRWMCNKLNIRRSSYYEWLNRSIPENEQKIVNYQKSS